MDLGSSPHQFGQASEDFFNTWNNVVAQLMAMNPREDIPGQAPETRITPQDKAWLKQAAPVGLIGGVAVISTPNRTAKSVFERKLGDIISAELTAAIGEPIKLAISINSAATETDDSSAEPHRTEPPRAETPPAQPRLTQSRPTETRPAESYRDFSQLNTGPKTGTPSENVAQENTQPSREMPRPTSYEDDPYVLQYPDSSPQEERPSTYPDATPTEPAYSNSGDAHVGNSYDTPAETAPQPWNEGYINNARPQRRQEQKPDSERSWLNENYTFDNLVAGEGNRVVRAAAIAVAENPAQAYNPLFIWGGSGLGKTHILHAIGHRALELRPNLRVRYVSIEEYTNEWINSIRNNRGEDFKRKYRSFDILLVDDIQFLAGKPETQIEFFHNFNALHGAQKQIVLCSDRSPKELTELESRLRTRFQWGFTQDIQKPDLETRIAILRLKAERENAQVPSEVLSFIAEQKAESVRELEGALNKVLIVSSIQHTPVTLEMARDQLQDLVAPEVVEITAPTIISVTAEYFNLTTADLTGPGKARPIAHARQVAMYLCRELTDLSLPKVGNKFGGRDHTTAMYAERKIRKEMSEKRSTNEAIQEITARIKDQAR